MRSALVSLLLLAALPAIGSAPAFADDDRMEAMQEAMEKKMEMKKKMMEMKMKAAKKKAKMMEEKMDALD